MTRDPSHSPLAAPAILHHWISERCAPSEATNGTSVSLLFEDFRAFATSHAWSITAFSRGLRALGFEARKVRDGDAVQRHFALSLKPAQPGPILQCRVDTFCRCRRCKPPMSRVRAMQHSKRAAVAVAGLFFLLMALQFVRAWIGGQL